MEKKNEIIQNMFSIELLPAISEEKFSVENYIKFPLSQIPTLGVSFNSLTQATQQILSGGEAKNGLYKVVLPKGTHLAKFKEKSGFLGSALSDGNNQVAGQATLNPVLIDPTTVFMVAALANINKKLDDIQEVQQEIIGFLVQKERSELTGDLMFLIDVLNNYKHNWNSDKFKNNNHVKVLDIKQTSERKIDFYKEQILSKINKRSFFHSDQDVRKKFDKIQSDLKDYQLSLYLYSFSSFLEVMLLENFSSIYLDGIVQKIEGYSHNYRKTYTKCYDLLEKYAETSIQSNMLKGLASFNKLTGKTISNVPLINKSRIDEVLISSGNKIGELNSLRTKNSVKQLVEKQSANIRVFVDNINTVNNLYNQSIECLFDKENIYIRSLEE